LTYQSREQLFKCLQCSNLNYKAVSPNQQDHVEITDTPSLRSLTLIKDPLKNTIFKIDMVNNLEGMIWTEKELMLFCLSEKSDDEFDIASCGLGKLQGFKINDCITSNKWEKSWFVNSVDGLIYELGWKVYHDMIEQLESLKETPGVNEVEEEPINLVTCALKHKMDPVNIHYMMNFFLQSKLGSFRINKKENLLGFPA